MRTLLGCMVTVCVGCAAAGSAGARPSQTQAVEPPTTAVVAAPSTVEPVAARGLLGAGLSRDHVLVGADAENQLGVWVDVPLDALPDQGRPPLAVALVIDASGSMHGEKIQKAREAAVRFVERLRDGDEVALYAFDDEIVELMAPVRLDSESRPRLTRAIAQVRDDGNTNMYGAVQAGQHAVARTSDPRMIRRVVLLSDGQANVGPSLPADFAALARQGADAGTQVSAIGLGLDYDESTLGALAQYSEGRVYHLEHAEQLAGILEQEIDILGRSVATAAYVELAPAAGVVVEKVQNGRLVQDGSSLRIPLGNLYAGQERELLVQVAVDASEVGERGFGDVRLHYVDAAGQPRSERVSLRYQVTRDAEQAQRSGHERVHAMLASQQAAEAQLVAARMLNQGDSEGASQVLQEAAVQLQVAATKSQGKSQAKLQARVGKVQSVQRKAASSHSAREARGAALEVYDDAMDAQGY